MVGSGGTGASAGSAGSGGTAGCDNPAEPGTECIETVSGRLVGESGDPVEADLLVSACGPLQCNPGRTDTEGRFTIPVNLNLVRSDYSVLGHGRPEKAAFYFVLPEGQPGPDLEVGDLPHLSMPADGPSIEIDRDGAPAQSVTSGDVTLDIADGVFVRLDVESNLAADEGMKFRALKVPDALLDRFADPALGLQVLYGFEPFETEFEFPSGEQTEARLEFANTTGFAADSTVEILALGSYLHPEWVTPAAFEVIATGTVSSDGTTITMDSGGGVRYLTWVGLRSAP